MNQIPVSDQPFWLYFVAVLFSMTGVNLFIYSQGWYILDISSSKLSVGLSWSLFFTPGFLIFPILGKMLDSHYLPKLLIGFEFARATALILFITLLYYRPSLYLVYLMSAVIGLLFSVFYPSTYVVLKKIVPAEKMTQFSHLFELAIQISSSASILMAGFLYNKLGFFILMLIASVLLILAGLLVMQLRFASNGHSEKIEFLREYKNFFTLVIHSGRNRLIEPRKHLFGIFHLFPQNIIMALNIPLLLYVYETMSKGPVEYGILDALFGFAAMFASLFWAKYYIIGQKRLLLILMPLFSAITFVWIGAASAFGYLPYVLFFVLALFLMSTKIQCRASALNMIPKDAVGQLSCLYQTVSYITTLILAFLLSYLCQYTEINTIFFLLAGLLFLFTLLIGWISTGNRTFFKAVTTTL